MNPTQETDNPERTAPAGDARPTILLLGPSLEAVSGVSSHLNMLFGSTLGKEFDLRHFQVGSEGRSESGPARWSRLLLDPLRLLRRIRRPDIAAIHINSSLNTRAYWRDLGFLFVAKLTRTPVVYQVHGGALPARFFRGSHLLTAWLRFTLKLPERIVVLGSDEAAAWKRFLPGKTVHTIPNAIDCQPYRSATPRPPRRRLRAVYLGRLANGKGLCELLHGLASPALAGVRPHLVIAGSGPERNYLQRLGHDLGIEHDIEFAGPVFGAAKEKLLGSADLFVLPSYSEGLPYALLEAMAAGAVPVTTPVGAIPDVVDNHVHGLYVPSRDAEAIGDAFLDLHRDRESLKRMSEASRDRVLRQFDIRRLERDFHELYSGLTRATDMRGWAEA